MCKIDESQNLTQNKSYGVGKGSEFAPHYFTWEQNGIKGGEKLHGVS